MTTSFEGKTVLVTAAAQGIGRASALAFAAAGATVQSRLAVSINARPEIATGFTFIRPLPRQAEAPRNEAPVVNALIPVEQPNPGSIDQPLASSLAAIFAGTAFLVIIGGLIGHAHWRKAQDRLAMWVGRSAEHRQKAIDGFLDEIRRIRTEVPTEQELQDVKDYLTGSFVFALERNSNLAAYAIRARRFELGFDFVQRYPDLVRAVTAEQVREAAERHLHPDRLAVISAGAS